MNTARLLAATALVALIAGCASPDYPSVPAYNKYSVEDVLAMVKAGEPNALIIRKLSSSNSLYPLTATEMSKLHDQGMPLEILDYMHEAYLYRIRREERFQMGPRFSSTN